MLNYFFSLSFYLNYKNYFAGIGSYFTENTVSVTDEDQ
jgi:hypothetical protein